MFLYRLTLMVALFAPILMQAQAIEKDINNQVWIPFCKSLLNMDTSEYLSVHSADLIRAERSNQKIYGYQVYAQNTKTGFEKGKVNAAKNPLVKFEVELRFLHRLAAEQMAYEIGYYKSVLSFPDGKKNIYYSQFHVTLRKENGIWKILTDSSLPMPTLTEQEFLQAKPLQ